MDTSAINISLTEHPLNVNKYLSFYIACFSIYLILGLSINVYVLWLIVTGVRGTIASEFFTLNLTVSEIIFSLSAIIYFIFIKYPTIIITRFLFFILGLFFTGRPMFQCCICVERYLAVVHPVIYLKYKPLRYRVGCCGVVWLMVLGSCLLYMLTYNTYIHNIYCAEFLVLFLVKLFCCLSVLTALKRPGPGEEEKERQGSSDMKMRAFKIILIIMISMFFSYLPYVSIIIIQKCLIAGEFELALNISYLIIFITGLVLPFLYLHRIGKLPCFRSL